MQEDRLTQYMNCFFYPQKGEYKMEDVLLQQLSVYPASQAQDIVKLLYQIEFGCEHIVKDARSAENRLRSEIDLLGEARVNEPVYESIGDGLCRLNLRPALSRLTREEILTLFLHCAQDKRGSKEGFRKRVKQVIALCDQDRIPFDPAELEMFMATYDEKKCPPLSHSVRYHEKYQPAYRLVKQQELKALLKTKRAK